MIMIKENLKEKWEEIGVPSCVPGAENTVGYKVDLIPVLVGLTGYVFPHKTERCVWQTQVVCYEYIGVNSSFILKNLPL